MIGSMDDGDDRDEHHDGDHLEALAMHLEGAFDEDWLAAGPPRRLYERTVGQARFLGGDIDRSASLCALAVEVPAAGRSDLLVAVLLQDDGPDWRMSAFDADHVPDVFLGGAARRALDTAPCCRPMHRMLAGGRIRIDLLQVHADVTSCTLDDREVPVTERGTVLVVGPPDGVLRLGRADGTEAWRGTLDDVDRLNGGLVWDQQDRTVGDLGDTASIVTDHG